MKLPVLIALSLCLAFLAVPNASAGPIVQCQWGPAHPSGDTDCRVREDPCEAHVHMYDVEDALNTYEASCAGCGVHIGGGDFVQCPLIGPAEASSAAAAPAPPVRSHCWATEDGSGCTTFATLGPAECSYTSGHWGGTPHQSASCRAAGVECDVDSVPPGFPPVGCHPSGASALSLAGPSVGEPGFPCQDGIAQTWCDFKVGPCDVRVTPWTAWGDQYVVADCRGGGAGPTCHTEVHTQDPLHPEHYCAFSSARPCQDISAPPHAGFDCTVAGQRCSFYIWLDLNPPNPTMDCVL